MVESVKHVGAAVWSPAAWNEAMGVRCAKECGVTLTKRHWQVVRVLRDFYCANNKHPATRVFIKAVSEQNHASTMLELMQLFGERPLFTISYIAGVPKPPHCI